MDDHLGYEKNDSKGNNSGNSRNGKTRKKLKSEHGELEVESPRDRNGTFKPESIGKRESRARGIDEKILYLYAKGQSTRDIAETIEELYDVTISASLISRVTERVMETVREWQSRPLDPLYPIVYLDCIVLKIRQNQRVINKSMYLALGVNMEGHWACGWLRPEDILIACVDGLKGLPEAIEAEYPQCHSVVRKATRNRKVFPNDESAKKVVYLAIEQASKRWTMPIRNWKPVLNRFSIEFDETLSNLRAAKRPFPL